MDETVELTEEAVELLGVSAQAIVITLFDRVCELAAQHWTSVLTAAALAGLYLLWLAFRLGKSCNRNMRIARLVSGFNTESSRKEALSVSVQLLQRRLRILSTARRGFFGCSAVLALLLGADLHYALFGRLLFETLAQPKALWLLAGGAGVSVLWVMLRFVVGRQLRAKQALISESSVSAQELFQALVGEFGEEFNERLTEYVDEALAEKIRILETSLQRLQRELAGVRQKSEKVARIHDFYRSAAGHVLAFKWSIKSEKTQTAVAGDKPATLLQSKSHPTLLRQDSSGSLQSNRSVASGQVEFLLQGRAVPARDCPEGSGELIINKSYLRELRSFFGMMKALQERAEKNPDLQLEISEESEDLELSPGEPACRDRSASSCPPPALAC